MKQAETEVVMGDERPRDRKGRRRLTRERRAEVVKEYEESGLTQAEFSRRAGLSPTTFSHWVQRGRREAKAAALVAADSRFVKVTPRFVEVRPAASPATVTTVAEVAAELSATLPDGVVLRGSDPAALAVLLRALRTG
jgi:transposase-like protein